MPESPLWTRARLLAALAVVPVLLFGPILAAGQVFLPFLPVVHEPLASENPGAAEVARAEVHATMGDRVYPFLIDQRSAREELAAGHLPTWEPLQTLGMPLFGGNVAALGYPPNWLGFLLPPERAAAPLALLALFLAGLGTYLFLARLELDPRAALVAALGVQLGPFALANLFYYMKVDSALWLPWALWAIEGLARGRRFAGTALAFALALSFLGGMVSIAVFVLCASGLYALVRLWPFGGERARALPWTLLRTFAFLALGVLGSAYWTLPVAEAAGASLRGSQSVAGTVASALPPASALGVLVPDLAGPPDDPTPSADLPLAWWLTPAAQSVKAENASVLEWNCHALVALALLALVGVVADPRRAAFPGLLLAGCFAFAQGWPVVSALYALPGLALGAPQRVLALAWILWPWLAALGLAALLARRPRALSTLLAGALVCALALLAAWRGLEPDGWARALESTIQARHPGTSAAEVEARLPLAGRLAAGVHLSESLLRAGSAALALFLAGIAALLLERRAPRFERGPRLPALLGGLLLPLAAALAPFALLDSFAARGPQALLAFSAVLALAALVARSARGDLPLWLPFAALLLVEGFLGSYRNVQGRSVLTERLFPRSATIEAIREAAGDGRVLRLDPTPDLADSQALARPNMLVAYGIADLTPYPTFTPRQAAELAASIDARMRQRNHVAPLPELALVAHPLLDLLRAQCVLSTAPLVHPRLAPVLERPGFCIYRRLGALPAARIVPAAVAGASDAAVLAELAAPGVDWARQSWIAPEDAARLALFAPAPDWRPGTITAVERLAKDRVRVRVADARGGWLVLHEQWARGWRATLDGAELPLLRADHYCRAVRLPDGPRAELVIDFEYAPRTLQWGAVLSVLALLGAFGFELLNRGSH
jgi:hypothetical protein